MVVKKQKIYILVLLICIIYKIEVKMNKSLYSEEIETTDSEGNKGVVGIRHLLSGSIMEVYARNGGPEGAARVVCFEGSAAPKAGIILEEIISKIKETTFDEVVPNIPNWDSVCY